MITRYGPFAVGPSLVVSGVVIFAIAAGPVRAQQQAPTLAPAERTGALDSIKRVLGAEYVFPEMRAKLVERLSRSEQEGRYDVTQPLVFADRITEDLRDVAHDSHLSLTHAPARYAAAMAPPASPRGAEAFYEQRAVRRHHGLAELRILPGNIRYLRITGFSWVRDRTGEAYDGAMRFLREGDAVIIDIRGNGGGDAAAVQYLTSHFLPADTLLLTFLHGSDTPYQSRSLSNLPAGRLLAKPLYVLIDGNVASAAEEFAYHVQQFKLGELVGARTAGGANNNELRPIAPGFILSVSVGRPVHPVSGTNWEGKGIEPSVAAAPPQSLDVAQSLALARLAAQRGVTPELLAEYAWARTAVEARLRPVTLAPAQLRRFAGDYGEIHVELRDGTLWLVAPDRPVRRLSPLTADGLFGVDDVSVMRVRFTADVLELRWMGEPEGRLFRKS